MPSDLKVHGLGTPNATWNFPLTNRFKPVDFHAGSGNRIGLRGLRGRQGQAAGVLLVRAPSGSPGPARRRRADRDPPRELAARRATLPEALRSQLSALGEPPQQPRGLLQHRLLLAPRGRRRSPARASPRGGAVLARARRGPASVSSTSARRPSSGRAGGSTRPSASRSPTVCAIDCGRTRSAAARSLTLLRALAVEPAEHGALREREAVLGAQPADELAEHDAQLAGEQRGSSVAGMRRTIRSQATDRLPVQFTWMVELVEPLGRHGRASADDRYKWIALSNTTLGVLLATLDASITLIAMPDIFRGIHLDPLRARQQLLPAVDDPRLPGRHERADRQPRPARRHVSAACGSTTSASSSTRSPRCCWRSTG